MGAQMAINVRYQMCVMSVGDGIDPQRDRLIGAVLEMGHIPIDLVRAGLLEEHSRDTVDRHIARTDYLILVLGRVDDGRLDAAILFESSCDWGLARRSRSSFMPRYLLPVTACHILGADRLFCKHSSN